MTEEELEAVMEDIEVEADTLQPGMVSKCPLKTDRSPMCSKMPLAAIIGDKFVKLYLNTTRFIEL